MEGKQLIMLSGGAAAALALTALLQNSFEMTLFASFLFSSVPTLVPVAFCAFYRKNGMSFGQMAKIVLRHKVRCKQVRLYRTDNFYSQLAKNNGKERFNGSSSKEAAGKAAGGKKR
jgi:hypothetical protein